MTNHAPRPRPLGRRLLASVIGVGLLVAAAACTSSSDSDGGSASPSPSADATSTGSETAPATNDPTAGGGTTATDGTTGADGSTGSAPASATASLPPAVTTPVPAPGGGNISETVPTSDLPTQPAVELDQPGDFGGGVTITLDEFDKITTTAQLPGEIAGPGLALTFTVTNDSDEAIDLGAVVVDVSDKAGTPAIAMTAAPAAPFSGELAAGDSATGVYVVTLPQGFEDPATIAVTYSAQAPVVVFTGTTQ